MSNLLKRLITILMILLLLPTYAYGESEDIYESKIMYSKSSADYFMSSLDDVMREELVRSVLSEKDEVLLAKMLWGEDRQHKLYMRAAIIWCVFNRLDLTRIPIDQIVTHDQFPGYLEGNPVKEWAVNLIWDVAIRYVLEQNGFTDVGRVLPKEFIYYEQPIGKTYHVFKTKLKLNDPTNTLWDWSLPSPYAE